MSTSEPLLMHLLIALLLTRPPRHLLHSSSQSKLPLLALLRLLRLLRLLHSPQYLCLLRYLHPSPRRSKRQTPSSLLSKKVSRRPYLKSSRLSRSMPSKMQGKLKMKSRSEKKSGDLLIRGIRVLIDLRIQKVIECQCLYRSYH